MDKYEIISAKDAQNRSNKLKSCWSNESLLELRTLIYAVSLLEKIANKKTRKVRKISGWNKFLAQKLKEGISIQEASKLYQKISK